MNRRTNSLTAAALSIGVDANLLEWLLPMLQDATAEIKAGKATPQDVAVTIIKPVKQCGTFEGGPCSCGE